MSEYIPRRLEKVIRKSMESNRIIYLTGPRQSGKTSFLRSAFPELPLYNLDRSDHFELLESDLPGVLHQQSGGMIIDEAQRIPELHDELLQAIDKNSHSGLFILSGSQNFHDRFLTYGNVKAGRDHHPGYHLFPYDISEASPIAETGVYECIKNGFYPHVLVQGIKPADFYPSYVQGCMERDIRLLRAMEQPSLFINFLRSCAGHIGRVLNLSALADNVGIAVNTAKDWLGLLEANFLVYRLESHSHHYKKRIIKSPKLYFYDTGLASCLLRIPDASSVGQHYLYGALFENLVISEIVKYFRHSGTKPPISYWRESNGMEINCLLTTRTNRLFALEIKGGRRQSTEYFRNLKRFDKLLTSQRPHTSAGHQKSEAIIPEVEKIVVYAGADTVFTPDTSMWSWHDMPRLLDKLLSASSEDHEALSDSH